VRVCARVCVKSGHSFTCADHKNKTKLSWSTTTFTTFKEP